ncbi:MAG: 50S ribosomal protein L29 [Thermoanaerobaculia bacterium]
MKAVKASDLRQQTAEELRTREREIADQLFALRLAKSTGQLDNPSRISGLRREMAKVLTVLAEQRRKA